MYIYIYMYTWYMYVQGVCCDCSIHRILGMQKIYVPMQRPIEVLIIPFKSPKTSCSLKLNTKARLYIHIYICTYMYAYIYIHTYIDTFTYNCIVQYIGNLRFTMFQPSNKLKTNCASVDSGHRKMLSKSAPGSRAELGSVGFGLEFPNFHGEIMENSWNIVVYHGICIPNPIIPITISA